MAFWGVEVKSGKSFTHSCEKARGRLRISQATLGYGDAAKKSVVQCNVGRRSPVLLCVLLPNQTESCNLDLEFDEAEDVVFSVIGPRSVYLTGYYVSNTSQPSPQSDTESYGVNIEHSQEESSYCSEDDKYENSFIDDEELQTHSSPGSNSRGNSQIKDRNGRGKRLRKKNQVVYSDDCYIKSEEKYDYLLNIFNSKKAANSSSISDEKIQVTDDLRNDVEALEEIVVNKEASADHKVKENSLKQNNTNQSARLKKKRKPTSEEKPCQDQNNKDHSVLEEDKDHAVRGSNDMETVTTSATAPPESGSEDRKRSKRRRKERESKGMCTNGVSGADHNTNKTNSEADASQLEKKTKKKTKKKYEGAGDLNMGLLNMTGNPENSVVLVKSEDQTADVNPFQRRTLSNGLIIEEIAYGPPDGRVATAGKKVKIYYTAKSKEKGYVLDSNVGKTACKLLLESEGVFDGWKYGINGMRVGDKRRLTVPPSLCSGIHGAGENLPPNTWIVYEVELRMNNPILSGRFTRQRPLLAVESDLTSMAGISCTARDRLHCPRYSHKSNSRWMSESEIDGSYSL